MLIGFFVGSLTLGAQSLIQMSYTAPVPPIADAGADTTVLPNAPVLLNGTAANGTAPFTYLWSPASLVDDATIANPTATVSATTTLQLVVTDANNCRDTSQMTIFVSGLGLSAERIQFGIAPNPGTGLFDISARVENGFVELMDLNGRLLAQHPFTGPVQRFDWTHLPQGVYLIVFSSGEARVSQRIIIQK
jgi:hypothetical protein